MNDRWRWVLAAVLVWMGPACLESNPQPSPIGGDDEWSNEATDKGDAEPGTAIGDAFEVDMSKVYVSAASDDGTVLVIGLEGAAQGAAEGAFYSSDASFGAEAFPVDEDGSFYLALVGTVSSALTLEFGYVGTEFVVSVDLTIPEGNALDDETPWLVDATSGFDEQTSGYPSEQDGWYNGGLSPVVTVAYLEADHLAQVAASDYVVTPMSQVILSNLNTEDVVLTQANTSGSFLITLPASRGDAIGIFAVNPLSIDKATAPLIVSVPLY